MCPVMADSLLVQTASPKKTGSDAQPETGGWTTSHEVLTSGRKAGLMSHGEEVPSGLRVGVG